MDRTRSRRTTLKLAGGALAAATRGGVMKGGAVAGGRVAAADEFESLRAKWRDLLTGGTAYDPADPIYAKAIAVADSRVQSFWERMDKSANRTALYTDLPTGTSETSYLTTTYTRLADLARVWATRGSRYAGNDALRADIISGLDWMYARAYNETKTLRGNWWDWEIGTPLALNNATTLLYDQLSSTQRENYMRAVDTFTPVADIFYGGKNVSTGANRVWKAEVVAVRAAIVGDAAKLAHARDSLGDVFPYVTSGDGFYADGSFIQHGKYPYTGGYGTSLLTEIGNLLAFLGGSSWTVTDPRVQIVFAAVHRTFAPVLYRGALMDMVRGREISRSGTQDHVAGHATIRAILTLVPLATPRDADAYRQMIKGWIAADTYRDFLATAPLPAVVQARAILDDPAVPRADAPPAHIQFPSMDRVVHRRPGFAYGISMSSERIFTYESINRENLHAWYTGDGMTYLYNDDLAQFSDDFWATVNPYRLPGTTVDARSRVDGSGQSTPPKTHWVGGASLPATTIGAVGMELAAWDTTLTARKSWFCLDDIIVALGTGITSRDNRTIETVIENRKLRAAGDNALTVDGATKPLTPGWYETMQGVNWAHIEAVGGYVFSDNPTVRATRETRSGAWGDINKSTNQPPVAHSYLTLWLDHESNPRNATYAYTLLPNRSPADTAAYAAAPEVTIIANDTRVQAVHAPALGVIAANFWSVGDAYFLHTTNYLSAVVQERDGTLIVALADPTHAQETVTLTLDRAARAVMSSDPAVTVRQLAPSIVIEVDTRGAAGATHSVTLALM